jgi:hypothetical protein
VNSENPQVKKLALQRSFTRGFKYFQYSPNWACLILLVKNNGVKIGGGGEASTVYPLDHIWSGPVHPRYNDNTCPSNTLHTLDDWSMPCLD